MSNNDKDSFWNLQTLIHVPIFFIRTCLLLGHLSCWDFPGGSDSNKSACNAGDPGWIPVLGRSLGEGNGNPLQYSCLENPVVDRGAWRSTVRGVAKSRTRLSDWALCPPPCEKASVVACSLRSRHTAAVPKRWLSNPCFSYTGCLAIFP